MQSNEEDTVLFAFLPLHLNSMGAPRFSKGFYRAVILQRESSCSSEKKDVHVPTNWKTVDSAQLPSRCDGEM